MARNKIKNPLLKRVPREFIGDWKKYIVVTIFLIAMIGVTAGVYVANNSMMAMFETIEDDYIREDGNFELQKKASTELIDAIESGGMADIRGYYEDKISEEYGEKMLEVYSSKIDEEVTKAEEKYGLNEGGFQKVPVTVYENFYMNLDEGDDCTVRVFRCQNNVDLPCIHAGRLPESANEIAIDRLHANTLKIKVGDSIEVNGSDMEVVGLISLANYTALYPNNSDTMFNAKTFDVALVSDDGFENFSVDSNVHYMYSWIYNEDPEDKVAEKTAAENFMKVVITQVAIADNEIVDFLPGYVNQGITFAQSDVGKDMTLVGIMLYFFIAIVAFVFAITISTTIVKESAVIGTLRASGYSKGELIAHYMAMPLIVTLVAGVMGNVLGYTALKNSVKNLYYSSYSLPVYKTLWSSEAFIKTTLIPVVLVILVNFIVIAYNMRRSPLKFLRHDLKMGKNKNAASLPNWKFLNRFRTRILIQNRTNYIVLALGVICIMFLMFFGFGMPETLTRIQETVPDTMFVDYQVVLKSTEDDKGGVITTSNPDAEKFAIEGLIYKADKLDEGISVYGLINNSKYMSLPELGDSEVVISKSFADKYRIEVGDSITLDAEFENASYTFKVAEINETALMSIYMDIDSFISTFDLNEDYFSGYLSSSKITDIANRDIAKVITVDDLLSQADQLDSSVGAILDYFSYVCVLMATILIYLLTKVIIEKNEIAISMTKILGYKTKEIASLYLVSTTWVMIIIELAGLLLGRLLIARVWELFTMTIPGWFSFYMSSMTYVKIFILVFGSFLLIMLLDYIRIKKVPMTKALKNVE